MGPGPCQPPREAPTRGGGRELVWTNEASFLAAVGADGPWTEELTRRPRPPPPAECRETCCGAHTTRPRGPALHGRLGCQLTSLALRRPHPEGLRRGACGHGGALHPNSRWDGAPQKGARHAGAGEHTHSLIRAMMTPCNHSSSGLGLR